MQLERVRREDWTVGCLALLLVIDLLFLPWFSYTPQGSPFSVELTAANAPDGWLGVLAVVAALGVLVDLAVELFSPQTHLPAIAGSRPLTRFYLAIAAAVLVALKFLFHVHFSLFGFGFWAGIVLTAALVYFTSRQRDAGPAYKPPLR